MQNNPAAVQSIFDNLSIVVEPQKYFQGRLDAIKAKCEVVNIVHKQFNELEPIFIEYFKKFLNCKVSNSTGGFFHKFEKGLPQLPKYDQTGNRLNFYLSQSYKSIYLKGSAMVSYETVNWRGEKETNHLTFDESLYLGETDGNNLTKVKELSKPFAMFDFEQVKAQLIKIDQLKRFLSSQESVIGCSSYFQNML